VGNFAPIHQKWSNGQPNFPCAGNTSMTGYAASTLWELNSPTPDKELRIIAEYEVREVQTPN
jgi:hypothetical protein